MVAAAAASIEKSSFVTQPTLSTFETSMSTLKISIWLDFYTTGILSF
jgi:hypothetical protein